jgi:hypothetical protein
MSEDMLGRGVMLGKMVQLLSMTRFGWVVSVLKRGGREISRVRTSRAGLAQTTRQMTGW